MAGSNGTVPPLEALYAWLENWYNRQEAEEREKREAMFLALVVSKYCVEMVYSMPGRRIEFQPEDLQLTHAWLTDALTQLGTVRDE